MIKGDKFELLESRQKVAFLRKHNEQLIKLMFRTMKKLNGLVANEISFAEVERIYATLWHLEHHMFIFRENHAGDGVLPEEIARYYQGEPGLLKDEILISRPGAYAKRECNVQ